MDDNYPDIRHYCYYYYYGFNLIYNADVCSTDLINVYDITYSIVQHVYAYRDLFPCSFTLCYKQFSYAAAMLLL